MVHSRVESGLRAEKGTGRIIFIRNVLIDF